MGPLFRCRICGFKAGQLINVGSEVSEAAMPLLGMYVAAKHAVKGFTDALRIEVEEVEQAAIAVTLIQPQLATHHFRSMPETISGVNRNFPIQ